MARNKLITDDNINDVVTIIRNWPKQKIGWSEVCIASKPALGYIPTRQGLERHQKIKDAFQAKKVGLKKSVKVSKPLPSSLAVASDRISRLNDQVTSLKEENDRMRDKLVIWQQNAFKNGMTRAQLEMPLLEIDRRTTL